MVVLADWNGKGGYSLANAASIPASAPDEAPAEQWLEQMCGPSKGRMRPPTVGRRAISHGLCPASSRVSARISGMACVSCGSTLGSPQRPSCRSRSASSEYVDFHADRADPAAAAPGPEPARAGAIPHGRRTGRFTEMRRAPHFLRSDYVAFRDRNTVFLGRPARAPIGRACWPAIAATGRGRVGGARFQVLGVKPFIGRVLMAEDYRRKAAL